MNLLFVCTGNTCRSPMAEAIARELLGGRSEPGDDRQVVVASAGVSAHPGDAATPEATAAAAELGLDLSGHRAQPLTARSLEGVDRVLTMTAAHRDRVLLVAPEAAGRTSVLDEDGDIADPFGGSLADYRVTAEQIKTALLRRFQEPVS